MYAHTFQSSPTLKGRRSSEKAKTFHRVDGSKRLNTFPEVTKVSQGDGLPAADVRPKGGATSCAVACGPIMECAGFAVDFAQNRCVFYWKEDVEDGDIVEQDGYELYL